MSNPTYTHVASETGGQDLLADLALDVAWARNRSASLLWSRLNPELWDRTHNPWAVLQTVSGERLEKLLSEGEFRRVLDEAIQRRAAEQRIPRWFQQAHPETPLTCVAYFSMEYMLSEALPIYSGGLGNVAGDQLKSANDLGVPVVGVGLLYSQGYFRQQLDRNGNQRALFPFNDPGQLPVRPVRNEDGDWLRLTVPGLGGELWIRVWEARVGHARLLLLDTNDPANFPEQREITSELYGGDLELRLRQEQVLGIGGWRALRALGIQPEVCHLNEGHAAFAILERSASHMEDTRQPFANALTVTRAGNVFTTHTPVEAGFDRFPPGLMYAHFKDYCTTRIRISFDEFLALGRCNPSDSNEPFNMAYLSVRGSGAVNGVSRLHGEVSRRLFQPLFPRWPQQEVPIGHVTNGVHVPTWHSADAESLWTGTCGERCWHSDLKQMEDQVLATRGAAIWAVRNGSRKALVEYLRKRYARQVAVQGGSPEEIARAAQVFDANTLTLGFARRFATYKRPNLLLHDPGRLTRLLTNSQRPVQLVIAGKAHPKDGAGQEMIREWNEFVHRANVRSAVIFVSDYDMLLTEQLVTGVDVWINTPRRPWEASGTSGMKLLANGGLNLSELDGWWAEAYNPEVGWALGDGREHGDDPAWDAAEADTLYRLLETEVIPEFYDRDAAGVPVRWVRRVRASMARLTPQYSANRTVREYTESYYIPAAAAYKQRADKNGGLGDDILDWQRRLASEWGSLSFGSVRVESRDHCRHFEVAVYLGGLDPAAVRVELFASGVGGGPPERIEMNRGIALPGDGHQYTACVTGGREVADFTPRAIPHHRGASAPLEAGQILWQR